MQAALHTEYWEMSAYETVLRLAPSDLGELLAPSLEEERRFAAVILEHLEEGARAD